MRVRNVDPYRVQLIQLARDLQADSNGGGDSRTSNCGLTTAHLRLAELDTDGDSSATSSALVENDQHLLDEVQSALRRIDDGQFGECECCHESINMARLRVVPYARYCIHCAFELESKLDAHSALYDEDRADEDAHESVPRTKNRNTWNPERRDTAGGSAEPNLDQSHRDRCEPGRVSMSEDEYEEFDVSERKTHDLQPVFATQHDDHLWDRKIRRRRKRYE